MERKVQKHFVDEGFGFPVHLLNVPMVKVRGQWTPDVDYNKLQKIVLKQLAHKPGRLSGDEIHFIRQALEMTLQQFAKRLGLSHVAVIKWEKVGAEATSMNWSTEKDIRLFVLSMVKASSKDSMALYAFLEEVLPSKSVKIEVEIDEAA